MIKFLYYQNWAAQDYIRRTRTMLHTIVKKRAQILALSLVLSVLLIAATAFASTEVIGKEGGRIYLSPTAYLDVPCGALEEDTVISADMVKEKKLTSFYFGPSGTVFAAKRPAELWVSWEELGRVDSYTLYGEDGKGIEPSGKTVFGVMWRIPHFSLYYYRRR
jgi:hypothetical protein